MPYNNAPIVPATEITGAVSLPRTDDIDTIEAKTEC
jgi:hypothetical protein